MKMKKIKVAEATSQALNWMVAVAEGHKPPLLRVLRGGVALPREDDPMWCDYLDYVDDPDLGHAIIEREGINPSVNYQDDALSGGMLRIGWKANLWNNSVPGTSGFLQWAHGPTLLIAAMRCYVASKLGEEVEVPKELLEP